MKSLSHFFHITVYTFGNAQCSQPNVAKIASTEVLITKEQTEKYNGPCYDFSLPWKLQVTQGQYFNISLIDYEFSAKDDTQYGKINDEETNAVYTISSGNRYQDVFMSSGNEVEVTFYSTSAEFALIFRGKSQS